MVGKLLDIMFKEGVVPVAVHKLHMPVSVPHHWKTQVNVGLDQDINLGIIKPVLPRTPTTWFSRMVVSPK